MKTIGICAMMLLLATPLGAQAVGNPCGSAEQPVMMMDFLARYFFDPARELSRAGKFDLLPPNATREVVTDSIVCAPLHAWVLESLQTQPDWPEIQELGFQHNVFRYGPYYAYVLRKNDPPGVMILGYSPMLVFDAVTLELLAIILV